MRLDLGAAISEAIRRTQPHLNVLAEVIEERSRQDAKWGEQNHPDLAPEAMRRAAWTSAARYYGMPLADEAKQRTDEDAELGVCSWAAIAVKELAEAIEAAEQGDQDAVRTEVVQLAAVCVQWAQAIDRRADQPACTTDTDTEENHPS